jgi:hypothetical protein
MPNFIIQGSVNMPLNTRKCNFVLFPENIKYLKERANQERLAVSQLLRNLLLRSQEEYGREKDQLETRTGNASKNR